MSSGESLTRSTSEATKWTAKLVSAQPASTDRPSTESFRIETVITSRSSPPPERIVHVVPVRRRLNQSSSRTDDEVSEHEALRSCM